MSMIQFFNQGTSVQTAVGRLVLGGTMETPRDVREIYGIGGKKLVRLGSMEAAATGVQIWSPDVTYIAKFIRSAAGEKVASFPDHTVGVSDGSSRVAIWTLGDCQPAELELGCPENGELSATVSIWSASPSLATAGTGSQQATAAAGWTNNEIEVKIGGTVYNTLSWTLALSNAPEWENYQDGKAAKSKGLPDGIVLGNEALTCTITTRKAIPLASVAFYDDIVADLAISIQADNGSDEFNIAMATMQPTDLNRMTLSADGQHAFEHAFVSNVGVKGLTVTGAA